MRTRAATSSDAQSIAEIHVDTWRAAYRGQIPDAVLDSLDVGWRVTFWRERIERDPTSVFVAEANGVIAGFCDLIPTRDRDADPETVAEIASIYVHPKSWRQGAGHALCASALTEARRRRFSSVTLWVLASNEGAKRFYEAMGFKPDGATKTDRTSDGTELHEIRFAIAL